MADRKVVGRKRLRVKKTSKEQYEIYCSFLEQHKELSCKKDTDLSIQPLWDQLALLLNCTNRGPSKDKKSWQKTFENWRSSVRHKRRQEEVYRDATGGGPEKPSELKEIELRALALLGKVALTGVLQSKAEVGFGASPPTSTEETFIANCIEVIASEEGRVPDNADIVEGIVDCVADTMPIPISLSGGQKGRTKRKVQAPRHVQLENILDAEKEKTGALCEVGNQLRRLVELKEAELVESQMRTNTLNNIAEALKMLANKKRE